MAEALKPLIQRLKEAGYELVPVSKLIYRTDYHMDVRGARSKMRKIIRCGQGGMWYNDRTRCDPGQPARPASQGLYRQSTAWEVNAAYASLPSLRTWYNDRT